MKTFTVTASYRLEHSHVIHTANYQNLFYNFNPPEIANEKKNNNMETNHILCNNIIFL
jgi:hypothetical protein